MYGMNHVPTGVAAGVAGTAPAAAAGAGGIAGVFWLVMAVATCCAVITALVRMVPRRRV